MNADNAFDPQMLADDLTLVRRNYADFFAGCTEEGWSRPSPRGANEWNLRETAAHLIALTSLGNEGIQAALRGEQLHVAGLPDRFAFSQFNRRELDRRLHLDNAALADGLLEALSCSIELARSLRPDQLGCTTSLPIYNRPLTVVEGLGIQVFHPGLNHSAQVADPAGQPPLWVRLPPDVRHRIITRVMRALSLLYRADLGGDLRAVFAFEAGGEGGGRWHVDVSPDGTSSTEGASGRASLTIGMRRTDTFCRMFTGRINLPLALLTGELRLRGDLRLFPRFGSLFSVDARK